MSDTVLILVICGIVAVALLLFARRGGGRSYLIRRPRRPRPYRRRRF